MTRERPLATLDRKARQRQRNDTIRRNAARLSLLGVVLLTLYLWNL